MSTPSIVQYNVITNLMHDKYPQVIVSVSFN